MPSARRRAHFGALNDSGMSLPIAMIPVPLLNDPESRRKHWFAHCTSPVGGVNELATFTVPFQTYSLRLAVCRTSGGNVPMSLHCTTPAPLLAHRLTCASSATSPAVTA